jgi:hypothetical protein
VAEAAVVAKPHDIKGESVFAYVVLNVDRPEGDSARALVEELRSWVSQQLSPIAKPDDIRLTDNLPKTRSGKIMRRLLRAIARGEEITQDVSTLENPAIIEQLRGEPGASSASAPAPTGSGLKDVRKRKARTAVQAKRRVEPKPVKAKTKRGKAKTKRGKVKAAARVKGKAPVKAKAAVRVNPNKAKGAAGKSGRKARAKK